MLSQSPSQRRPNPVFSEPYRQLIDVLIEERHRAGVSQLNLSHALGKTHAHIWKIERGERRIDALELYFIAKALGVAPARLFEKIALRLDAMGAEPEL